LSSKPKEVYQEYYKLVKEIFATRIFIKINAWIANVSKTILKGLEEISDRGNCALKAISIGLVTS